MKKVVVPQKARRPNKVDKLLGDIKKIQEECKHDFRLLKPVKLKESNVKGFFILTDASLPSYSRLDSLFLKVKCLRCSKEKEYSSLKKCPHCLSLLQPGGKNPREKYFGVPHLYYAARLYYCINKDCGFCGVADEWDQ